MRTHPRVIIIGAGFGGLYAAKALRNAPVDLLLIDRHNYHTFQPLLYQVATSELDAGDIAHQVRGIFRNQKNFRFRQGNVALIDKDAKQVELDSGERLPFDYLITAPGAIYNDFGVPGVREHSFVLKTLDRATALRSHILEQFERAAAHPELVEQGALTFVLVGAGPTGVEMAGALSELFERVLPRDYPELDLRLARIVLVEAGGAVLPPFGTASQRYAERVLRHRGVDVRLGATVAEARGDAVVLRSGELIPTHTIIWAAGVRANPLAETLGTELVRGYRLRVEPDLSLPGHRDIFAIGDVAAPTAPQADEDAHPYPQLAQVAIQSGKHAAGMIVRRMQGRPGQPFVYRDLGNMAIVGRNAGIAELSQRFFNVKMRGFLGWLGWLFLHLVYLPGFRNRFSTLTSWAYNYVTYDRHARLILTPVHGIDWPSQRPDPVEGQDVSKNGNYHARRGTEASGENSLGSSEAAMEERELVSSH